MKEFIVDFFRSQGSEVKDQGHTLWINLSPELARYFHHPTLQLVFNSQYLTEDTELVTHGSHIFTLIYDLLKDRGIKTFLKLPKRMPPTTGMAPEDIQFCNGKIIRKRMQQSYQTDWYFNFKITYWFDEKIEETCCLRVDAKGLITRCKVPFSEWLLAEEKIDCQISRPPCSRNKIKQLYERCLTEVESYAREQSTLYQKKLMERLYKNLSRLDVYYRQSRDEITGTDERQKRKKLELLQQEYQLKVEEELDNHQIQVIIALVSFCSVQTPILSRRFLLRAYDKEKEIVFVKNLFSGHLEYPTCESCGSNLQVAGMCSFQSHIVCDKCLGHCQECDQDVCSSCGIQACESCQMNICQECTRICDHCGKWFCTQHIFGCRLCKTEFCEACARTCEVCRTIVCSRHTLKCTICEVDVCFYCRAACSHCEEEVCNIHLLACSFCGQLTCTGCVEVCEACGCQICTRHAFTCALSKKRLCPKDSNRCQACQARVGKEYIRNCDIGREKICVLCVEVCSQCQIPFCPEHSDELEICNNCGEIYCLLCQDRMKTCLSCESLQYV